MLLLLSNNAPNDELNHEELGNVPHGQQLLWINDLQADDGLCSKILCSCEKPTEHPKAQLMRQPNKVLQAAEGQFLCSERGMNEIRLVTCVAYLIVSRPKIGRRVSVDCDSSVASLRVQSADSTYSRSAKFVCSKFSAL